MHEIAAQELTRALFYHAEMLDFHSRVLLLHCACLGMNAENCQRAILGQSQAYTMNDYLAAFDRYGFSTEKENKDE